MECYDPICEELGQSEVIIWHKSAFGGARGDQKRSVAECVHVMTHCFTTGTQETKAAFLAKNEINCLLVIFTFCGFRLFGSVNVHYCSDV